MNTTTTPKSLTARLCDVANLSEFARVSGIPSRTLDRVKAGGTPSTVTSMAIEAALKKHKPKLRSAAEPLL